MLAACLAKHAWGTGRRWRRGCRQVRQERAELKSKEPCISRRGS